MIADFEVAISKLVKTAIIEQVFPGVAWAVGDTNGTVLRGAAGVLDPDQPASLTLPTTIFDVASLTKVMAVWASVGALWEGGVLDLAEPLGSVMPEVAGYPLAPVTVHHLLTHTAGVPLRANLRAPYGTEHEAIRRGVLQEGLHRDPGTAVEYTDRAALITGLVIEHVAGVRLDEYVLEHVWRPLGMLETQFGPLPAALVDRAAPTEIDEATGLRLRGVAHDFSARLLGGVCGIAGVFSPLSDIELFLRYLSDGRVVGPAGFGQKWVAESLQIHTGNLQPARGFFWHPAPGTAAEEGIYVHYGFTGTAMWVDRAQGLWATLLTNKLYFSRDREPIAMIRDAFRALVFN
ncbi:beta-lactamase family protein [Kribbella qitaiheensis]|uniref:Beta-lactamase family protein n=1 Tax=Kribbella qitaiheensis TaxID=1544730 RepID=A0A7G6WW61_9ACTN|nr:serine hydrolase domain-containing protein [Kribbella qitaiheensis]QNE18226.1 beta-lactamase family protein [Kribbella qitaiheensis]